MLFLLHVSGHTHETVRLPKNVTRFYQYVARPSYLNRVNNYQLSQTNHLIHVHKKSNSTIYLAHAQSCHASNRPAYVSEWDLP